MVVFDRVTPTLLGLNASLIVLFLTSCMVFMSMFAAGQSRAWREAVFAAEGQTLPTVEGEKNWGPSRLWKFFVKDNNKFGHGVYMTEWGGVGAIILNATDESFRYITAVFVHDSVWHLLLVGGCCAVAGALVERR
jgi:membrane associated rhomboid family serine protease